VRYEDVLTPVLRLLDVTCVLGVRVLDSSLLVRELASLMAAAQHWRNNLMQERGSWRERKVLDDLREASWRQQQITRDRKFALILHGAEKVWARRTPERGPSCKGDYERFVERFIWEARWNASFGLAVEQNVKDGGWRGVRGADDW